jgi:hypothetical protein
VALLEDDDPLLVRAGLQQNAEAVKHFKTFTDVHDEASRPAPLRLPLPPPSIRPHAGSRLRVSLGCGRPPPPSRATRRTAPFG